MSSTLKASSLQNVDQQEFFGSKKAIPEPILEAMNQPPLYVQAQNTNHQQELFPSFPSSSSPNAATTVLLRHQQQQQQQRLLQHQHQHKRRSSSAASSVSSAASSASASSNVNMSSTTPPTLGIDVTKLTQTIQHLETSSSIFSSSSLRQQQQKQQSTAATFSSSASERYVTLPVSSSSSQPKQQSPAQLLKSILLVSDTNRTNENSAKGKQISSATAAIASSSSSYTPLTNDWRTLSITSNISTFEPILISRLQVWKKEYGISSTVLQVTAPNACGIVRLLPIISISVSPTSGAVLSSSPAAQNKPSSSWAAALPPSFGIISEINKKINQQQQQQQQTQNTNNNNNNNNKSAAANAPTFTPLAPIDLPACANLSRSIVAVIMSTLDVCSRLEVSVLRVVCHDFSEFSHPSTLHNSNNTAMLISMFENRHHSNNNNNNNNSVSTSSALVQQQQSQNAAVVSYSDKVLHGSGAAAAAVAPSTAVSKKQPSTFKSLQLDSVSVTSQDLAAHPNNNFGSVGNLASVINNNAINNFTAVGTTTVASSILLNQNATNTKNINTNNHNIFSSKVDAFFSVPVVSPFLAYSQQKPQHYVMEHQKNGIVVSSNNKLQQQQQPVAIYKVMDLVHDNVALQSLLYPEQWIYSLCYFVAEVLMLFDGRDTPCRTRHAEKAISVFPSFVFTAFENKNSGTSAYQQSLTITSFSELRQALYEVANLDGFAHQGDKKALQSRIPPRRRSTNHNNSDNDDNENSNTQENTNTRDDPEGTTSEDTVARFIFFVYERLRLVQKGKYIKLANFLRTICEMPLGVIPLRSASASQNKNNKDHGSKQESSSAVTTTARNPPLTTPSLRGGAASLFYGFHRRGPTCAETALHHQHFVNRVAYRGMLSSASSSATSTAIVPPPHSSVVVGKLVPPPNYSSLLNNNNNSNSSPLSPLLKLSVEQSQELTRWNKLGITNCVIHVFGNEQKKIIYLTPITSCLNEPTSVSATAAIQSTFTHDNNNNNNNNNNEKNMKNVPACSISWTILQQHQSAQTSSSSSAAAAAAAHHHHHKKSQHHTETTMMNTSETATASSTRSATADLLTAAMTVAEVDARAPALRIIFHNLWAFRDSKLTISDFTPEDPFFVAYVMSAVKNTDRLIDLLFINNQHQDHASSAQNNNNNSVNTNNTNDSSLHSNDSSNKTTASTNSAVGTAGNVVIAENHWIGGMIQFLRASLQFLKEFNTPNETTLEKNLDETLRLLHNFRTPLLSLAELKSGLLAFVAFMKSSSNVDLHAYFDNSESILDWLNSLLCAVSFLQEMNKKKNASPNNSNSINYDALIKMIRFLITVSVLPMRPTQHQVFEADERGRKIVSAPSSPDVIVAADNNKTNTNKNASATNASPKNHNEGVSSASTNKKTHRGGQNKNSKGRH